MTKIVEKLKSSLESSGPSKQSQARWESVSLIESDEYDEPMLLQQRFIPNRGLDIMYPWDKHRLIPLSKVDLIEEEEYWINDD